MNQPLTIPRLSPANLSIPSTRRVNAMGFTADGELLATGDEEGCVIVCYVNHLSKVYRRNTYRLQDLPSDRYDCLSRISWASRNSMPCMASGLIILANSWVYQRRHHPYIDAYEGSNRRYLQTSECPRVHPRSDLQKGWALPGHRIREWRVCH